MFIDTLYQTNNTFMHLV